MYTKISQTVCLEIFATIILYALLIGLPTHTNNAYASYLGPSNFGEEHKLSSFSPCNFPNFFENTCLVYSTVFLIQFFFIILNPRSFHSVTQFLHWRPTFSDEGPQL